MEQYTDDERVEDLKKWWKENGASIIVGIALGVMAIFGWRYWNSYRDAQAETASRAYDAFIEKIFGSYKRKQFVCIKTLNR